jgi:hypothetical protein
VKFESILKSNNKRLIKSEMTHPLNEFSMKKLFIPFHREEFVLLKESASSSDLVGTSP